MRSTSSADDGPRPGQRRGTVRRQLVEAVVAGQHDLAACRRAAGFGRPSNAQNMSVMRPFSAQVGDGLGAAAGEVEVGDRRAASRTRKRVVALRRQVDVAVVAARRRRHEEHRLAPIHSRWASVELVPGRVPSGGSCRSGAASAEAIGPDAAAAWPGGVVARPGERRLASTCAMPRSLAERAAARRTRSGVHPAGDRAGAAPSGRRYWPMVTMSTPTPEVGERGHDLVVRLAHARR